ncbi:MAG TPA: hypothetical protein VJ719_09240 [Chthoniobacterales bacterium]|nr:hypothetical protein [Chthoniobacterales bacterium]
MNKSISVPEKVSSAEQATTGAASGGSSQAALPGSRAIHHRRFSPRRILAIGTNTLTELTRLKVFYFLLFFGMLLIGGSVFLARFSFQQEFQILKDISLGAMSIFSSLLAVIATARLIPQDIEDRTIYSILAKPVPRFEYLLGRLGGVLLLLALTMAAMSVLFLLVLYTREQAVLRETAAQMTNLPADQLNQALQSVRASALNADLFPAIAIIYLKACLLASLTLFVSTFASTNIFTVIVMVFVYFIGHLQATAREYWLHQHGADWITQLFLAVVALVFPDLQAFNLVDEAVLGNVIPIGLFLRIASLGVFYMAVYIALSVVVFSGKEL